MIRQILRPIVQCRAIPIHRVCGVCTRQEFVLPFLMRKSWTREGHEWWLLIHVEIKMRVVSFNILAQPRLEDHQQRPFVERMERIVATLESLRADILFLQEVTPPARRILVQHFEAYFEIGPLARHNQSHWSRETKSCSYGNLTMIRASVGSIRKHYSRTKWHKWGTAFDINEIELNSGQRLHTANIHLDSENHKIRMQELRALLRHWKPDGPSIVAGDFNSDCYNLHQLLLDRDFIPTNPFDRVTCMDDGKAIDFIYVRVLKCKGAPKSLSFEISGSDHFPVLTTISRDLVSDSKIVKIFSKNSVF